MLATTADELAAGEQKQKRSRLNRLHHPQANWNQVGQRHVHLLDGQPQGRNQKEKAQVPADRARPPPEDSRQERLEHPWVAQLQLQG
jgi:hypothetical protein